MKKSDFYLEFHDFSVTKTLHSKFLGPEPVQASKILLEINSPPMKTPRVPEFRQFIAKKLTFPINVTFL